MTDVFNVDDWISGLKKPRQPVKIYQRPDIAGQIELLEQKVKELAAAPDEESLGASEIDDLNDEIDRLAQEFHESAVTFWVQSLGPEEIDEIGEQVRKDCKARTDEIAAEARKEARANAKRLGVDSPTEINRLVRETVQGQVTYFLGFEISLHLLAKAIDEPRISVDQLRTVAETLGQGQINKLRQAFDEIAQGDPGASIAPKSSRRGTTDREPSL